MTFCCTSPPLRTSASKSAGSVTPTMNTEQNASLVGSASPNSDKHTGDTVNDSTAMLTMPDIALANKEPCIWLSDADTDSVVADTAAIIDAPNVTVVRAK